MPDEELKGAPPAEPRGKVGPGVKVLVFLPAFGCLGALMALELVMTVRSLFAESLPGCLVFLGLLVLTAALAFFCLRRYRSVRHAVGGDLPIQIGLAGLAWCAMFAGAAVWRSSYQNPGAKMSDQLEDEQQACEEHARSVLSVHGVSDSHEPGTGYITVKATFQARTPVTVFGGAWVNDSQPGTQFYSEMERTELLPGQTREITFHVLVNPEHDNSPAVAADGPYFIPEIRAYVYDRAVTGHWATWAKDISCIAPVIKDITTKPYKASEFGRVKWTGGDDSTFKVK